MLDPPLEALKRKVPLCALNSWRETRESTFVVMEHIDGKLSTPDKLKIQIKGGEDVIKVGCVCGSLYV